jgi:hypothetical protein
VAEILDQRREVHCDDRIVFDDKDAH